eukprot:3058923-Amphidinium_carterae.1
MERERQQTASSFACTQLPESSLQHNVCVLCFKDSPPKGSTRPGPKRQRHKTCWSNLSFM